MFHWLNKQGVQSERGFIVQSVSRGVIEYREGSKCISVEVEDGFLSNMKPCEIISANVFEKWNDGTPVPVNRRKEILQNFINAMEFQGISVKVEN